MVEDPCAAVFVVVGVDALRNCSDSEGSRFLRGKAAFLLAFAGGSKEFPLTQRGFDHAA